MTTGHKILAEDREMARLRAERVATAPGPANTCALEACKKLSLHMPAGKTQAARASKKGTPKQTEKRERILAAARELLAPHMLELPSVNAITERAGIAKGTFYLYFDTREELYIDLLAESYESVVELMLTELERAVGKAKKKQVAAKLAGGVKESALAMALSRGYRSYADAHPQAIYLSSIAVAILERNVSDEKALEFKRQGADFMSRLIAGVESYYAAAAVPAGQRLDQLEIARRLLLSFTTGMTLWQTCHPPANMARILKSNAELAVFRLEFEDALDHALNLIWA